MSRSRWEIFYVNGMFCKHCERRIEEEVSKIPGVRDVSASFPKGEVQVLMEDSPEGDAERRSSICAAIAQAGYEAAGHDGKEAPDERPASRRIQIASILIILLGLYVIASHLGCTRVFSIFPRVEEGLGLGMVFVIGLLTSVHCIAMCGGINLTQSTLSVQQGRNIMRANAGYNLGRMISYTIVGSIAGGIGSVLSFGGMLRGAVAILAGVVMVLVALQMLGLLRLLPGLRMHLPAGLYERAAAFLHGRGGTSIAAGLLNGLMPCGPLQAMQLYALSTGSVLTGALSMLVFAAGTVPLMFGFGALAGKLNRQFSNYVLTVSALLIFVLGIHMAGTGLTLSGIGLQPGDPAASTDSVSVKDKAMASVGKDRQTIRTEIDYGTYPAFTVRAGIPAEWTIHVPEGKLNGCNGEILVPEYDLDIVLTEGDNVVTFTPEKTGVIPYSCWMGMIKSEIRVVE